MKQAKSSYTLEEALRRMGQYCAYQDRCHKEVRDKLKEMKMIPEAIDHIMGYLIEHDFLNEQRFADSFTRGKFRIKKWGRVRIMNELRRRELSAFTIKKALEQISDQEYLQVFDQVAKKRYEALRGTAHQEKRRKLSSYLLYRGWESHMVHDKVRELLG